MKAPAKIQWAVVVVAAFVIEAALFAILIPVGILFGMQVFLVAVPIGVFVITYLLTVWFGSRIQSRLVLHGLLIGLVATLIYLGLLVAQGAMATAIATYGPVMFVVGNGLRVVEAVMGGVVQKKRRLAGKIGTVAI